MSSGAGTPIDAIVAAAPPDRGAVVSTAGKPGRSLWRQAITDTFRQRTAVVGAAWIGLLVIFGVFGPFIANSHPLLLKMDDRWSSPLLRHLTSVDVLLLCAALVSLALATVRRTTFAESVLILLGALVIVTPAAALLIRPPVNVVYDQYREAAAAGRVQFALHVPIPYSPSDYQRDLSDARLKPPGAAHLLGTETNGADVASRLIHASRIALAIGFIATGIEVVIGVVIGGLMGYFVGWVDMIGMRLIEVFEAIPRLFLLISFIAYYGPLVGGGSQRLYLMMVIIGLTGWTGDARFIRAEFLRLRNQDFVQAAKAAGLPLGSILFRHLLPNGISPILVSASFGVASAILLESTLSFLGLGLVDDPSWGQMLNQARAGGVSFYWWIATFPGLAIFLTVLGYNLIGESLRDALDPRTLKRAD